MSNLLPTCDYLYECHYVSGYPLSIHPSSLLQGFPSLFYNILWQRWRVKEYEGPSCKIALKALNQRGPTESGCHIWNHLSIQAANNTGSMNVGQLKERWKAHCFWLIVTWVWLCTQCAAHLSTADWLSLPERSSCSHRADCPNGGDTMTKSDHRRVLEIQNLAWSFMKVGCSCFWQDGRVLISREDM